MHLPTGEYLENGCASEVAIPIKVWRDRLNAVVRVVIQNHEFVLREGNDRLVPGWNFR